MPTRIVSRSASSGSGTCLITHTSRSHWRATRSQTEPITLSRARPIPRAPITTRSCCEPSRSLRISGGGFPSIVPGLENLWGFGVVFPVHHPRLELEARLSAQARHAVEIAVGNELEPHRDQA